MIPPNSKTPIHTFYRNQVVFPQKAQGTNIFEFQSNKTAYQTSPKTESDSLTYKSFNSNVSTQLPFDDHFQRTRHALKSLSHSLHLDHDILLEKSNEIDQSLPSSRSMVEMQKSPHTWAEIYENEAWALPHNYLLDKKYHWWRKVSDFWKKSSDIEKNQTNNSNVSEKCFDIFDNIITLSDNGDNSNTQKKFNDIFPHLQELTKHNIQSLSSDEIESSALGSRRKAINQWIIDVSVTFNFNCSTHSLCIQILDSYLEKKKNTEAPVNVNSVSELMVICVACLMLSAAMREHRSISTSEKYLSTIMNSSKHNFTFQDVIIAQSDILNTINPHLLASFIFFDYCLFFLAELRDKKFPIYNPTSLFQFLKKCGLLPWLFEMLHRANKYIINESINLCVPGSRIAACFLLFVLSKFSGKNSTTDLAWLRIFSHYILHMHYDGDISFWLTFLQERISRIIEQIETSNSYSKSFTTLWNIASEKWQTSDKISTAYMKQRDNKYIEIAIDPSAHRNKRDRPLTKNNENIAPNKHRKVLLTPHAQFTRHIS